ncbi:MAG: class II glutamine amidotransferase [Candidatus Caldarchaeum sp.]
MCQLLGISSNRDVDITFSFREWRHRGDERNPHGYGFAWWKSSELQIVKAASSLYKARDVDTEEVTAARSQIFIAHVRLKSVGPQDGVNTHPFTAPFEGRLFAFAHNGTVSKNRTLHRLQPEGTTDSEHAFLWLLEQLAGTREAEFASRLTQLADEIRQTGSFNFLMSDGRTLWAYADSSLHFIERRPPYGGTLVRLKDDGYTIRLREVKRPDERAVLVATQPLTDEAGWQKLHAGDLLVIRDGVVVDRLTH